MEVHLLIVDIGDVVRGSEISDVVESQAEEGALAIRCRLKVGRRLLGIARGGGHAHRDGSGPEFPFIVISDHE